MMWSGSGAWWGLGLIFMLICMVMMVWMMSHGHHSHSSPSGQSQRHTPDEADRILGERLARGEIDTEEYERRLAALHQTSRSDRT